MPVTPAMSLPRSRPWLTAALVLIMLPWVGADSGRTAESPEPLEISKEAWFTAPTKDALPPILVNEFPPSVVCILIPESCGEDTDQLTSPVEEPLRESEIPAGPVQPVAPGTLPAGLLGGHPRHASLVSFTVPPAPADARVEQFDVAFHESGLSYALESPAFRELVRAFVAQAAEDPSQEPFERFVERVASQESPLARTEPTGLEACAVVEEWEEGENQEMEALPALDCAFGANGVRSEDGTWTFDLSTTVQAWIDGTIPNHGIYIGPVAPPNVEYGDPDPSTNFQVSVGGAESDAESRPTATVAYGTFPPAAGGAGGAGGGAGAGSLGPGGGGGISGGGGGGFAPAPPGSPMGPPAAGGEEESVPPGTAESGGGPVPAAGAAPYIPGWMWALVLLGVGGAIAFARVVGLESSTGLQRSGALSRLVGPDLS